MGAVQLSDNSGNLLATTYGSRSGPGPAMHLARAPRPRSARGLLSLMRCALDGAGDVFIADAGNERVVKVPAGGGSPDYGGYGAECAECGVAVDGAGDVFIADVNNNRWWRFRPVAARRPRWAAD